jgi:hypothetical protein
VIDLDRIDEYCSKATGEPWVNMPEGALWGSVYSAPLDGFTEICVMPEGDDRTPDFDFIAQARTDLPAVVAELREAREILREGQELMAILHPDSSDKPLEAGCIYNEWLSKVRKFLGVTE